MARWHWLAIKGLRTIALLVAIVFSAAGCGASSDLSSSQTSSQASSAVALDDSGSYDYGDQAAADDTAQSDWDSRVGSDWDEFAAAFETGFYDGCTALFENSPDGTLHNGSNDYEVSDCEALVVDPEMADVELPVEVPDDIQFDGNQLGAEAGCDALFTSEGIDELYWGTDTFTSADCI